VVGGACLAFVWHTLNSLGTETVEAWRLGAAGLAIVGLLAVVGFVYRYLSALSTS
jgi:hypothetical protein